MASIANESSGVNSQSKKFRITVQRTDTGGVQSFEGREAWALRELINAGARGCTPIDNPAPRWSHYVWLLRDTFVIETIHEPHGGLFQGTHARYVLRSPLVILQDAKVAA